jgi:hypothetical protein
VTDKIVIRVGSQSCTADECRTELQIAYLDPPPATVTVKFTFNTGERFKVTGPLVRMADDEE